MPVLKPGTQEYRDYYNAITLPGDTPPSDDPFAGAEARGKTEQDSGTGRKRADMSGITRDKPSDKAPAASATSKAVTVKRATARDEGTSRIRADMSSVTRSRGADPFIGATARGATGTAIAQPIDSYAAKPTSKSAKSAALRVAFLPFRNEGGYNLAWMVESGVSAQRMHEAGFSDKQIVAALTEAMRRSYGSKEAQEIQVMAAGCCGPWIPEKERIDKLGGIMADIHAKLQRKQEAQLASEAAAQQESERTHVALPGEKSWYHWPTGQTVSDEEYRKATNGGRNASADEYSRAAPEVRRGAIETVSAFMFLSSRAALPERTRDQETTMDALVSFAQLATWAMPFIPKGGSAVAGAAGAIFGINTAQHWDSMSTTGKAVSVAATALLLTSSVRGLVQPSFKPVKVPLKDGTEAVVWSGLSVRGTPVVGVTKLPPNIAKVAPGWRPITKTETTVLGTRKMLERMGVADDEVTKVLTTVEETKAFQGMRSPYEPKSVSVEDVAPQALTPDELAIVLKNLAKNKKQVEMVYGSTTIKPQLAPSLREWRKLGDIEAQLKAGVTEEQGAQLAKDIVAELNKGQPGKFTIDPADPKRIMVRDHHAVELKLSEVSKLGVETKYSLARTGEMSWGMKVAEKPISVDYPGVGTLDIMRLSESGVRKSDAITRSAEGGTFAPPAHRVKDIADYYVILYTFKGEKTANAWAKLYGFDSDTLLAAAAKDPPKLEAWRFTPGKTTATSSPTVRVSLPPDMATAVQSSSPALYREVTAPMPSAALASSMSVRTSPALLMSSAARASVPSKGRVTSPALRRSPELMPSSAPRISSAASSPASAPTSPSSPSSPGGGTASGPGGTGKKGPADIPPPSPPPPSPPPPPIVYEGEDAGKRVLRRSSDTDLADKRPQDSTGRVQWKQGAYWIMVEPPAVEGQVQRNVYYSRRPFWGVRVVKGNPERTFSVQGNPPKQFLYRMGIVQADIFTREKPHLRYRQTGAGRGNNRRGRRGRLI